MWAPRIKWAQQAEHWKDQETHHNDHHLWRYACFMMINYRPSVFLDAHFFITEDIEIGIQFLKLECIYQPRKKNHCFLGFWRYALRNQ